MEDLLNKTLVELSKQNLNIRLGEPSNKANVLKHMLKDYSTDKILPILEDYIELLSIEIESSVNDKFIKKDYKKKRKEALAIINQINNL